MYLPATTQIDEYDQRYLPPSRCPIFLHPDDVLRLGVKNKFTDGTRLEQFFSGSKMRARGRRSQPVKGRVRRCVAEGGGESDSYPKFANPLVIEMVG